MQEGWLIRDGEVLASAKFATGRRARIVLARDLCSDVGAVMVSGPSLIVGVPVARFGGQDQLRSISPTGPMHFVGFARRAVAVLPSTVGAINVGDTIEFRAAT